MTDREDEIGPDERPLGTYCDAGDLENPLAMPAIAYADGLVVGGGDMAKLSAHLAVGDTLIDSYGSDVHFIVRSHGPAIPKLRIRFSLVSLPF